MTRERDRIQENANSYIVKNCPAFDNRIWIEPTCNINPCDCENITDCVIKQAIEKCKDSKLSYSNLGILRTACETNQAYGKAVIAEQILQLFDIEETNK